MVPSMSMQSTGGAPIGNENLVTIGGVGANADVIMTPGGSWPLAEVNVTTQDQTTTTTHTPTWAIVMTVVTVWFFLLGLLFLLARERRVQGNVAVTVWAGNGQSYTEFVPISSEYERAEVVNRVAYLQGIIGQARWRKGQG
jgi:hypothetical protein